MHTPTIGQPKVKWLLEPIPQPERPHTHTLNRTPVQGSHHCPTPAHTGSVSSQTPVCALYEETKVPEVELHVHKG